MTKQIWLLPVWGVTPVESPKNKEIKKKLTIKNYMKNNVGFGYENRELSMYNTYLNIITVKTIFYFKLAPCFVKKN